MNPRASKHRFSIEGLEAMLSVAAGHGLSPALRARAVPTQWSVVTGTYSSGKTTLVRDVAAALEIPACDEPARTYIEARRARGESTKELWTRAARHVVPIHEERLRLEASLDPDAARLLDTAIPDTLAYALFYGTAVPEIVRACGQYSYREPILVLEPLPMELDPVRNDDAAERLAVQYLRSRIYSLLGYLALLLPALSRPARLDLAREALRYGGGFRPCPS